MGTTWSEIITDYAMVEIDDLRMRAELQDNPALFFRGMSLYMKNAIPYFNNPPEMQQWLKNTPPSFADYNWTVPADSTEEEAVVATGQVGYELMSVQILSVGNNDVVTATPYGEATYDAETGNVTFPAGLTEGTQFQIDFYTDGQFDNELTGEEKRILGLCVDCVWSTRFSGNWLNMQPKIQDANFSVGSEANYTRSQTERMRQKRIALNDEIHKYAQNIAYREIGKAGYLEPYSRL